MINYSGSPTLINCIFTCNSASQIGGGLYNSDSSPILISCTFSKNRGGSGGGIINSNNSSPTLNNCMFHNNIANSHGSGMCNSGSSPRLTNCTFTENSADMGGGIYNGGSNPTLIKCVFINNQAEYFGGGMCNEYESSPMVTDCIFSENLAFSGSGIYNSGKSHPTLINCTFNMNTAEGQGGGMHNIFSCNPTITNCVFSYNRTGSSGGGMFNHGSNPTITNCTFNGNSAGSAGGGIYNGNGNLILTNCLITGNSATDRIGFWYTYTGGGGMGNYENSHPILTNCTFAGNVGDKGNALACDSRQQDKPSIIEITNCIIWDDEDEISNGDNSTIIINYSNIQEVWLGEGNIDTDPCFVDPGYWANADDPNIVVEPNDPNAIWIDGDYHLKSQAGRWDPVSKSWVFDDVTSPCIDAGDPNSPIAFEPFPNGGTINMGAYGGTPEASMSPSGIHIKYGGGTGEPNNPYLIYTAEQMNTIGAEPNDSDKHFKLMADIDLGGFTGTDFNIIGVGGYSFKGAFDGNGHTISNFSYTSSNRHSIGLFRQISGQNAQIKDLGLVAPNIDVDAGSHVGSLVGQVSSGTITNCYVEGGSVSGEEFVGGLVGWNHGNLNNCYSTCSVAGKDDVGGLVGYNDTAIINCSAGGEVFGRDYVGGLAGRNDGTIKNSSATGSVTGESRSSIGRENRNIGGLIGDNSGPLICCSATGDVSGDTQVGGLAGKNSDSIINSYATGSVAGFEYIGGLVGYNTDSIINCYATGNVSGTTYVGGLVGYKGFAATVLTSFWDIQTSGQLISEGGISRSTAEMQTADTFLFAGWDFVDETTNGTEDIWWILEGQDYPRLWWEPTDNELLDN